MARRENETNLATVSVGNTRVNEVGQVVTLNYYTATRAIAVTFDGFTTTEHRLPYLTARMTAAKFDNSIPAGLVYDQDAGAISFAVSEDDEKGTNDRAGPYVVRSDFADLEKFSHRDLIDFRAAIIKVTYNIPKSHWNFRDNIMRKVFDMAAMQRLNLEKFPPQLDLRK